MTLDLRKVAITITLCYDIKHSKSVQLSSRQIQVEAAAKCM